MARIRTVKPELFSSFTMSSVSIPARFLFVGLLTEADDAGRLMDSPKKLCGILFPHDENVTERKVAQWLNELVDAGCINRYSAGQGRYLFFPNWTDHQKISHPTESKFPEPSGETPENFQSDSGDIPPGKGTGKEEREQGKGRGSDSDGDAVTALSESFDSFWKFYPSRQGKKLGKDKARKIWDRLKPAERDLALIGVHHYAESTINGPYAKDAERWLRDKCWTDWQEPATPETRGTNQGVDLLYASIERELA